MESYKRKLNILKRDHEALLSKKNQPDPSYNGWYQRYKNPILTSLHTPLNWRFDLNIKTNPYLMERIGINSVLNPGAIKWNDKYLLMVRVEGVDRKSFFAVAESDNGIDNFRFRNYPVLIPETKDCATNIYDMRLTQHEDGWIYGLFCAERYDSKAADGDLSKAIASAGVVRTKDMGTWERLPDIKSAFQQRNVVLHPEFVDEKYALYTRPQSGFIKGGGMGIGWSLVEDITNAELIEEKIINRRQYHTISELKNGEGPSPIKTEKGWIHLAHGVRECAAGLRYVLYLYMTSLDDPSKPLATPGGYFMAPKETERVGDVSNVLFSNGWICDDDGKVFIYYASSDTKIHVATTTVERLLDYCFNTPSDGNSSTASVEKIIELTKLNLQTLKIT